MTNLKLFYFDTPGRGEQIRWTLEMSGQEWEDKRLSPEQFQELKPSMPNGQVPVLEVDGFLLAQSTAILRYVGKLAGLYPTEDDLEAAKCDSIMECTLEVVTALLPSVYEEDEDKKKAMRKDLSTNYLPTWIGVMSKQLEAAGGNHFCSDKLTVADISVVSTLTGVAMMEYIDPELFTPFPKITALMKTVTEEPKIAAFIAKHAK